ncbi:MAG: TIGR02300 family protein [Xanthobacteraceae bacterium]
MAKPELGTKRLCGSCGAKFYDLSKDPIVCPKCATLFEIVAPVAPRGRGGEAAAAAAAAAARAPAKEVKTEPPETADVELVSLEDADAETEGKKAVAEGDDDIEIEETEEAPFIEEEEEGADDVSDIIGEGREDEEET